MQIRLLTIVLIFGAGCGRCSQESQQAEDAGADADVVDIGERPMPDAAASDSGTPGDVASDAASSDADVMTGIPAPTVELAPVPGCSDADPPERCGTDVAEWATAALLTRFTLEGSLDDPICCIDVDGDGEIDNSAGVNLSAFGSLDSTNDRIARDLEQGDRAVALELVRTADRVDLSWWPAQWGPGMTDFATPNRVLVHRAAIDAGTQPRFWMPDVALADGALTADAGFIELPFVFSTVPVEVDAHVIRAEATVVEDPALEGFSIEGWLQIVAPIRELRAGFDELAQERCACLGLGGQSMFDAGGECREQIDSATCTGAEQAICVRVEQACATLKAAELFADLDLDGDGFADGMSAGFSFEAQPAVIEGLTP